MLTLAEAIKSLGVYGEVRISPEGDWVRVGVSNGDVEKSVVEFLRVLRQNGNEEIKAKENDIHKLVDGL